MKKEGSSDLIEPTRAGRARPWPLIAGLGTIFLGVWGATQWFANALAYQPGLGDPIVTIGGHSIYPPFAIGSWLVKYRIYDHPVLNEAFRQSSHILIGSVFAAAVIASVLRYTSTRDLQKPTPDLHGTAGWLPREDVMKSGLVGAGRGVYIGGWYDTKTKTVKYLRHDGPEHIDVTAPTRSGKGVGLILPTLLSWQHSVVVHDIKGEAWALTAGFRKNDLGHTVLRFDPTDSSGKSARFNPISEVRLGKIEEVADAMNIAAMIVDPDGKGMTDHWAKTGHELLSAGILHVLYAEQNKTLRGLVSFFCDPNSTMEQVAETMLRTEHDPTGQNGWQDPITLEPTRVHPMIAEAARSFLNKSENERSGVQSTAMSFLSLYRDPIVAMNTSHSDFRPYDLMNSDTPVSLYIVNKPSDKSRLKPLIRLLMSQIIRTNVRKMEFAGGRSVQGYKHRLLWLHDEASSTGKLEVLEDALPYMAGYGIKAYLIWQDREQKRAAYGQNESVSGQTHIRLAFAPNTIETAKWLSEMLGTTTRIKTSIGYSGKRGKATLDSINATVTETARPLMTPDEVMRLPAARKNKAGDIEAAGDMLVMVTGQKPIYGRQILYFLDPTFDRRSKIPPPDETDRIHAEVAPLAPLPRPTLPATDGAVPAKDTIAQDADDEAADWSSPPLTDAALADYPEDDSAPPAYVVHVDDAELELGPPIEADIAALASIADLESERPSDEPAAFALPEVANGSSFAGPKPPSESPGQAGMTLKDMLLASQVLAMESDGGTETGPDDGDQVAEDAMFVTSNGATPSKVDGAAQTAAHYDTEVLDILDALIGTEPDGKA